MELLLCIQDMGYIFDKGAPKLNWMLYYPVEKFCAKYTDALLTINEEDYDNVRKYHFPAKQIFCMCMG